MNFMAECRACGGKHLELVINLGLQPPSNAYLNAANSLETLYPLRAVRCTDCHLMQLSHDVDSKQIFNADYAYFSSNSKEWLAHTEAYAKMAISKFGLRRDRSVVYEIGGNDGHLLKHIKDHVIRAVNIEPSKSVADASHAAGVETWCEFWKPQQMRADLIIANNVMAHTPDLRGFVKALSLNLKPYGVITIEFPHVLTLLDNIEFDTIYHEHYSYFSLTALEPLFAKYGLRVYDVDKLPTHGGSLRLYVSKFRSDETPAVTALRSEEHSLKSHWIYDLFAHKAHRCKEDFLTFLSECPAPIVAYTAPAKGNTFLNYCGVNRSQIKFVADTTLAKQGKFLPGTRIPIVAEQELLDLRPEYVLLLAWNWKHEIISKLRPLLPETKFVTAIPHLEVL